jgi:hypothetical protein
MNIYGEIGASRRFQVKLAVTRASDKFDVFENSVSSFPDKKVICGIDAYKQRM